MAEQEFKIDTGNKIFMGLSILVLLAVVAFLVYHLVNFVGQLALGEREPAPELVETVDQRIAPVGRVEVAAVDPDAAPDEPQAPAEVYASVCAACHTPGAAGAPRLDDTEEWAQRLDEKGLDTLVSHSIDGFQGMPARGGDPTLSDEEVAGAVEYILVEAGLDVDDVTEVAEEAVEPEPEVAGDVEAGEGLYAACASCHGAGGEGAGIFPGIAGQSTDYLTDRLTTYRAGEEVGPNSALMIPHASDLSDEDIADLAAYIATLGEAEEAAVEPEPEPEAAPEPEVAGDAEAGEGLYAACASCHGAGGEGAGIFPGIAGQSTDYLTDRLTTYRAGEEVGPNSALMIPHASGLSDEDIADLATYIATLGETEEAAVEPEPEPEPEAAPEPEGAGDAEAGEGLYAACASCHGAGGEGSGIFPGIAGQSTDYLTDRLTTYRAGEEVGPNSALMIPHASDLSDEDIADLAAYIESL